MLGKFLTAAIATSVFFAGACAPAANRAADAVTGAGSGMTKAPKTLTIAQDFEPPDIEGFGSLVRPAGSGNLRDIVHNHLTRRIRDGVVEPELAAELPSVDRGTWTVNPDGTMDVTWKLRPGVTWHDGTPFTSADMVFSLGVFKNPALPPTASAGTFRSMRSATALDDLAFVVHWSQVDATAPEATGFIPLARHLLEESYTADNEAFANSPRFRTDFVGLGAYRLVNWELGSHMELARHEGYFTGRPPLDTVVIRFIHDANTIIANLLSGAADVSIRPKIDLSTAIELKERWERAGNQAFIESSGRVHYGEAQRRTDIAKPRNGLTDPVVRRAFLMAVDRQGLSDAFTQGFAPLADSYVAPDDPLRPEVEQAIVKYPYDPAAASRLLAEAGWTRGPDGTLVHRDTGEPFEGEVWAAPEASNKQEPSLLADQWNALGARLSPYHIPVARVNDRELAAKSTTFTVSDGQAPSTWYNPDRLHSRFIAAPANSWAGRNKFGNNNPRIDDLLDRLQGTIDNRARVDLHRQLIAEETSDMSFFPFYWEVVPSFVAKGISPSAQRPLSYAGFAAWTRD